MELRHLRSFVYVAETKSFSTAATRCCVTQSAVRNTQIAEWLHLYLRFIRSPTMSAPPN